MDRPTEAFKQAQHDANATYYCDCYHGPKAVQAIIVYAEHLESKVERLRGALTTIAGNCSDDENARAMRDIAARAILDEERDGA